jgi:glycerol kinase
VTRYVGAIDQGTTSTRFMVVDLRGHVIAVEQKEHRQIYPQPGWVEHDPMEIWGSTQAVIEGALNKAQLKPADLAAIGVTNQRETTVVWDRTSGRPLHNAIVWQDTRTEDICAALRREGGQDRFRGKTGLPIATYFSGPKIQWILEHVPGARAAAERGSVLFGTIDTWLIWWLTGGPRGGVHVTDVTNASRTLLMDLSTLEWDDELLRFLRVPRAMLPAIHSSSEFYGTSATVARGVPLTGDLGDQQAALVGQTCFTVGESKNTYGTGCFILQNTGTTAVPSRHGLLTTVGYKFGSTPAVYALEGSVAITGALVQWLRDNLGLIRSAGEIEALAGTVADHGGVYFVPAFSGLFAPYWRSDARGIIAGLTRFVQKGHIARAALEATAYQTREVLDAMLQDSGIPLPALKVDGGMVRNDLLMQFQADILGVPVVRPTITETTALGAAYAAALAAKVWSSTDDLTRHWRPDKVWEPHMGAEDRARLYQGWQKAVTRTFDWIDA